MRIKHTLAMPASQESVNNMTNCSILRDEGVRYTYHISYVNILLKYEISPGRE